MERLTHKARYEAGYKLNKGVKEWQAADRLGAYENTGLTPPEIMELKYRDTEEEISETQFYGVLFYECPICNEPVHEKDNFCSKCGQRLKKED